MTAPVSSGGEACAAVRRYLKGGPQLNPRAERELFEAAYRETGIDVDAAKEREAVEEERYWREGPT